MKKVLIIVLVLIFAGAVLSRNAYAAELVMETTVSYKLPYPGLLPDSPFYFIKNLRDQVVSLLVMGPVNQSFYNLLMADKRLLAGQMLIASGNTKLGSETLLSAEDYFTGAVDDAYEAKKLKNNISELAAKLLVSSSKHEEVLTLALGQVSGKDLDNVAKAASLNQKARALVVQLSTGK